MDRNGCALEEGKPGDFEEFLDPVRRGRDAADRVAFDFVVSMP
jgi:hypothetical protein